MAKAPDKTGEGRSAQPADSDRFADALKDMPAAPLHPLMAHPTAAFAAATAIGFGLATHMTSVFLGSLHGALEASGKLARRLEEEQANAEAKGEDAGLAAESVVVADVKPSKASRSRPAKARTAKPMALKPATPKPATANAAAAKPVTARRSSAAITTEAPKKAAAVTVAKTAKANGRADDLKKIEGIGPKLEQVLNARGIRRFADLAALAAAELEALDAAIGLDGRAIRDDWAGQARKLARGRK
ncbi:unnamed protein product [Ciceribacter sp. T2.26MG-112.2]|uniref:5' DNA nuclease n=1 Tax=Ciceribacter sp. T2.26MG-112.2 TaxID=3137154 RepID=UPI000E12C48D|nr:5' DNA nuclease [Ciceribacter naphthalenivorans]SSC72536.1 unnamed protein product [Ciceribacter naphthalenivorans]